MAGSGSIGKPSESVCLDIMRLCGSAKKQTQSHSNQADCRADWQAVENANPMTGRGLKDETETSMASTSPSAEPHPGRRDLSVTSSRQDAGVQCQGRYAAGERRTSTTRLQQKPDQTNRKGGRNGCSRALRSQSTPGPNGHPSPIPAPRSVRTRGETGTDREDRATPPARSPEHRCSGGGPPPASRWTPTPPTAAWTMAPMGSPPAQRLARHHPPFDQLRARYWLARHSAEGQRVI